MAFYIDDGFRKPDDEPAIEVTSTATTYPVFRVLRVIEYVGTREFVDDAINKRTVKGMRTVGRGQVVQNYIQESIIGETAQLVGEVRAVTSVAGQEDD